MIITILLVVLFTAFGIYLNYKNKFIYVISLQLISIIMAFFIAMIYMSKGNNFRFPFSIDYDVYLWMQQIKITIYTLSRLYNLCFALFMVNSVICIKIIRKMNLFKTVLIFVPIVLFVIWCDPNTTYNMYISGMQYNGIFIDPIIKINRLFEMIFTAYLIMPTVVLVCSIIKTRVAVIKNAYLVFNMCITICNMFILSAFDWGMFKCILFCNVDVSKIPVKTGKTSGYLMISGALFICILLIIVLLVKYRPFGMFSERRRQRMQNRMNMLDNNLSMILHIYKNAFLAVGQQLSLIKINARKGKIEEITASADLGINVVDENINSIANTLKALSADIDRFSWVNVKECIKSAVESLGCGEFVKINAAVTCQECEIYANAYHLTEAFVNILRNSMDAIEKSGNDPEILVEITQEESYYIIEIIDNGIGMEKSELQKIFELFYSTKPRIQCGGVGLSYVKNIVESCGGRISVVSGVDKGTNFQLVFPQYKKRRLWHGHD